MIQTSFTFIITQVFFTLKILLDVQDFTHDLKTWEGGRGC
jgi:hypothetical protein